MTNLRNPDNTLLNSTAALLIIDSKREIDIGLAPFFSQNVIGEDQTMVNSAALDYLQISSDGGAIELYFSLDFMLTSIEKAIYSSTVALMRDVYGFDDQDISTMNSQMDAFGGLGLITDTDFGTLG